MREEFITAIETGQGSFGLKLTAEQVSGLADLYQTVIEDNDLLHLVAPCSAEEFAVRHVLESLTMLDHLPRNARFADVGPGAGFPAFPCLLVRNDLSATLIESKEKKANYLAAASESLGIESRVSIVNRQFEEAGPGNADVVTCRALDKFTQKLPKLVKWSKGRKMLLFGGPGLRDALEKTGRKFSQHLMPMSDQRFLFVIEKQKVSR